MFETETDDAPQEGQEGQPGYCIEIQVGSDGKITVGVEPAEAEAQEGSEPKGSPVANIKEALQVAMDIYKNGGQVMDANAGEADFASGFASGPTQPEGPARRFA
jgi:hypothetical protein